MNPRGAVAIVGAGSPGLFRASPDTPINLAEQAVSRALDDAGLKRSQIDGLIIQIGSPRGTDYECPVCCAAVGPWPLRCHRAHARGNGALLGAGRLHPVLCRL